MRTSAVSRRTTLLLVRYRMQLGLPSRDGGRELVAEDARLLAYRGRAASADWLTEQQARDLAEAVPSGNIPPDQAIDFIEQAIGDLPNAAAHLDEFGDRLAEGLRDSHIRVREAAGQRARRQISVHTLKPADVLGVYIYLPDPAGGAA